MKTYNIETGNELASIAYALAKQKCVNLKIELNRKSERAQTVALAAYSLYCNIMFLYRKNMYNGIC